MNVSAITGPHTSKIRPVRAALVGLAGERGITITIVVDDIMPDVVMYRGEPFLLVLPAAPGRAEPIYRQVRPFRADGGE